MSEVEALIGTLERQMGARMDDLGRNLARRLEEQDRDRAELTKEVLELRARINKWSGMFAILGVAIGAAAAHVVSWIVAAVNAFTPR